MATVVCETHQLRYDPSVASGCVVCLRERAPPPRVGTRWPLYALAALVVLAGGALAFFLLAKRGSPASRAGTPSGAVVERPAAPLDAVKYLPLAAENTWKYRVETTLAGGPPDVETREFVARLDKAPDGGPAFVLTDKGRGLLNGHDMVYAVREGAIVSFAGFFGGPKTQFDERPFVELPAKIGADERWRYEGTSSGRPFALDSAFSGLERISVPAGTFACARVERTVPNAADARIVTHYAPDVGVVRVEGHRPGSGGFVPPATFVWSLIEYSVH
ncbi:MAG: hypothetical protein U0414_44450 [Polyangiaceae bacterium]